MDIWAQVLIFLLAAIWSLFPIILVFNRRPWVNGIATFLVVTLGVGYWMTLVDADGFVVMFAMMMGPFLGPVAIGAAALKGNVLGLSCLFLALVAGWNAYRLLKARLPRHQLVVAIATLFGLAIGYISATMALSTMMALSKPAPMQANGCITRLSLAHMIKISSYERLDKIPYATLSDEKTHYHWSVQSQSWYVSPGAQSHYGDIKARATCPSLILQTH